MEKLVEVSEQEVRIDFSLGCKCRATVHLRSLSSTTSTAFKIQTSSPHKFLVNPPTGLIPPLSHTTFQVILKPQSQLPSTFPRSSPCDKFLIRAALAPQLNHVTSPSTHSHSHLLNSWFNSLPTSFVTQDVKLKVAFVGPFLLRHAVITGDCESVKNILKRQKTVLGSRDAESLLRVAAELDNSKEMVELLTESECNIMNQRGKWFGVNEIKGWSELHVAAANNRTEEISMLISNKEGGPLDCKDKEGRTALYLAANEGFEECVTVLVRAGANVDARTIDGRTALYKAVTNGDRRMMELLIHMGADPTIAPTADRGRSALEFARERGQKEVVELLERGEAVLNASRSGDVKVLEVLLESDAKVNYCDQYGLSPLHVAAIKGHKDVAMLLVEYGSEVDCEDADGHTPLHLAVESGDKDMVEILLNRGAHVNAINNKGATPLFISQLLRCDSITKLLLASGGA